MVTEANEGAPYDARAVANFILDLADERGVSITQMQLLKLLYFASGWFLAKHASPLIRQDFQAWEYGPVVKVVRDAFKDFGKSPIRGRAEKVDLLTGELIPILSVDNSYDRDFIAKVFESYHMYDGWELSEITHEAGSPWDQIWNCDEPTGRLGLKLNNEDIREYFLGLTVRKAN